MSLNAIEIQLAALQDYLDKMQEELKWLSISISRLKSGPPPSASSTTKAEGNSEWSAQQTTTASGKSIDLPGKGTFNVWDGDGSRMTWPGRPGPRTTSGSEPAAAGSPGPQQEPACEGRHGNRDVMHTASGTISWCRICGALQFGTAEDWRLPTHEPVFPLTLSRADEAIATAANLNADLTVERDGLLAERERWRAVLERARRHICFHPEHYGGIKERAQDASGVLAEIDALLAEQPTTSGSEPAAGAPGQQPEAACQHGPENIASTNGWHHWCDNCGAIREHPEKPWLLPQMLALPQQ